jgi:tetratricopeptide (TPR) repeat protein
MWRCVFLLVITSPAVGQASDTTFSEAYEQYQFSVRAGKLDEALPYAKLAYELGEKVFGSDHKNTASLTSNYGRTLLETKHYEEASQILEIAYEQYEKIYGKKSMELIDPLMMRGHASALRDQRPKRKFYDKAIKLVKVEEDRMLLAALNYSAGVRLTEQAKSLDGRKYLRKAYDIYTTDLGSDHPRTVSAAFYLGKIEMGRLNNSTAKKLFSQVIDALQPDQDMALISHALLVPLNRLEGDANAIIEHCKAVINLQIWNQICGPNAQTTMPRRRVGGITNVYSANSFEIEEIPDDVKKSFVRDAFPRSGSMGMPGG